MEDAPTPLRCFNEGHAAEKFVDDGVESVTSMEQVSERRRRLASVDGDEHVCLR